MDSSSWRAYGRSATALRVELVLTGVVDDGEHLAIVMQYYRRGNLEDFMHRPKSRDWFEALGMATRIKMACMVASALHFLATRPQPVVHGDIKPANLLLDDIMNVYITDFGLTRQRTEHRPQQQRGGKRALGHQQSGNGRGAATAVTGVAGGSRSAPTSAIGVSTPFGSQQGDASSGDALSEVGSLACNVAPGPMESALGGSRVTTSSPGSAASTATTASPQRQQKQQGSGEAAGGAAAAVGKLQVQVPSFRRQGGQPMSPAPTPQWTFTSEGLSVHTAAPEVLRDPAAPRDVSSDVYSFGIVLLQMCTGKAVYKGMSAPMIRQMVLEGRRPPVPASVPASVAAVVAQCTSPDPASRPSFANVIRQLEAAKQELQPQLDDTTFMGC